MTSLGLVVPIFEERSRFADYAQELVTYIGRKAAGSELVFVDDGSGDDTADLVDALIAANPLAPVRLLRRLHLGKGAAVSAGLASLHADIGAFCDLDLSTPLDELDRVIEVARRAEVLAIGSRDLSGSTLLRRESRVRETLGRSYNRLLQATVTPGIVDTQCGAKAAAAAVWAAVLPFCRQTGFAWDAELVAVAQALDIGVQEVPIAWRHDDRTKIRVGRDGAAMVLETGRIWASARRAARSRPFVPTPPLHAHGTHSYEDDLLLAGRRQWWFRAKAAYVSTALRRTGGAAAGVLVDAGAGAGGVTSLIGWNPEGLVLIELNARLAAHARATQGLAAVQGSATPLPIAGNAAAVVLLLDVLEHLADPAAAVDEARRVLAPGGRLVVTVPAMPRLWSRADEALGHRLRFRRAVLEDLLRSAGFDVVLSTHVFSWLVVPVWVERKLFGHGRASLGLGHTSALIDRAALVLTAVERLALGRVRVPLGTSLLVVARRPHP